MDDAGAGRYFGPCMTVPNPVEPSRLGEILEGKILGSPMPRGRRLLGVEYERLILDRETRASAPVDLTMRLMVELVHRLDAKPVTEGELVKGLIADGFELSMEPGGQIEIAAPPFATMREVDASLTRATGILEDYLAATPYELVSLGHAPVTPVDEIGLLPRERYRLMDARMPARGPLTRNMMRATAGFQLTYDVVDRDDAARKLALLYRLSPVLMTLCANSRRIAGADSGYASFRHHVWWATDLDRSGVPEGCLDVDTAIPGYIDYARRAHVLFLERDGHVVAAPDGTLEELVDRGAVTDADVDLHLSSLFPFVRLRNYIEIRCFDSVDWPLAKSVMALVSGLVYCDNAYAAAWELSEPFRILDPARLRALHEDAARLGLDAVAPDGRGFRAVADDLIDVAKATLGGATCDWSDEHDLDPVRAHVRGA